MLCSRGLEDHDMLLLGRPILHTDDLRARTVITLFCDGHCSEIPRRQLLSPFLGSARTPMPTPSRTTNSRLHLCSGTPYTLQEAPLERLLDNGLLDPCGLEAARYSSAQGRGVHRGPPGCKLLACLACELLVRKSRATAE